MNLHEGRKPQFASFRAWGLVCLAAFLLIGPARSETSDRTAPDEHLGQISRSQGFPGDWQALAEGKKPRLLTHGLEFVAVDTQATGDKEYTFSILLRSTEDIGADYHLALLGFVFPSNAKYLAKSDQGQMYAQWTRVLVGDEATSRWRRGEYHVVAIKAKSEQIPYNLRLILQTRNDKGQWVANIGQPISLGWQWAVSDESAFLARIEACKDFSALYALAPAGPRVSDRVAQALERKWKALAAGMTPRTLIKGLDVLAVATEATGPKEYTFSFLLRSTADLAADYHLSVIGAVDPSHARYIQPDKPGKLYTTWSLLLYGDPTSLWRAGEYHAAQLKVKTEIIPYRLSIVLQTRNARMGWSGNPGEAIALGWQADAGKQ